MLGPTSRGRPNVSAPPPPPATLPPYAKVPAHGEAVLGARGSLELNKGGHEDLNQ